MSAAIDIGGQRYGRLTAIRFSGMRGGNRLWLFRCDCGKEIETRASAARIGKVKSCGCLQREKAARSSAIARDALAKSLPPMPARFWSKVDRCGPDECWLWLAAVRREDEGYGAFYFNKKQQPASRIAWILTFGQIADSTTEVCHTCDNPRCCNPAHLFLGTRQQNNDDKVAKGRHAFGERVGTATLTEGQAREIKDMKPVGRTPPGYRSSIADRFSVSCETVTEIWAGRRWMHLR